MSKYVQVSVAVDGSPSMSAHKAEAVAGYAAFLRELQAQPVTSKVSLNIFSTEFHEVYVSRWLAEATGLEKVYDPDEGDGTAIYDAIGSAIDQQERLRSEGPVIIAILTDGNENASSKYSEETIRARVEEKKRTGRWKFIFIGPMASAGEDMGFDPELTFKLGAGSGGIAEAMRQIAETTVQQILLLSQYAER